MVKVHTKDSFDQLHALFREMRVAETAVDRSLSSPRDQVSREVCLDAIKAAEAARERYEGMDAEYSVPSGTDMRFIEFELPADPAAPSDEEVLKRIRSSQLPQALQDHLAAWLQRGGHRWIHAIRHDPEVILRVEQLIQKCREITGLTKKELLDHADFTAKDMGSDRLDAFIGELRSLVFLRNEGFEDVSLLKAQGTEKRADIKASRHATSFVFDVFCSNPIVAKDLDLLSEFIAYRYHEKQDQLESSKQAEHCDHAGIILVLNSYPALAFGHGSAYLEILRRTYETLHAPAKTHLAIITGQTTIRSVDGLGTIEEPGDVSYPPWPGRPHKA